MFRFLAGRNFIPQQPDPAGSPFRGLAEPGNAQGMRDSRLRGNDVLKKGDNLSPEDVAAGFTDYVIWNRFRVECLDIDGELPMECVDSGMVLLREDSFDVLGMVMRYAYGQNVPGAIPLP